MRMWSSDLPTNTSKIHTYGKIYIENWMKYLYYQGYEKGIHMNEKKSEKKSCCPGNCVP